jgi:hypothetical protein
MYMINKLELLTNATVVVDVIRFVSSNKAKEELKSASNGRSEDNSESKEPDHDYQELESEELATTTTTTITTTVNQVF